jgi:hypothetical protein
LVDSETIFLPTGNWSELQEDGDPQQKSAWPVEERSPSRLDTRNAFYSRILPVWWCPRSETAGIDLPNATPQIRHQK